MDLHERDERRAAAEAAVAELSEIGVVGVVLPWVDNSGITRVKTVPLAKLPGAAAWGVGMSPVFDGFLLEDSIVTGEYGGGAIGDLRLHPDVSRITLLAGQPGWAWAPVDRYTQDGEPHPQDARSLLRRVTSELAADGLSVKAAFEVEWVVSQAAGLPDDPDAFVPALSGPAYGLTRVLEVSDYARDLLDALDAQNVAVDQFHPEYAPGQLEVSVGAEDPVGAADTAVLVRATIRAVSAQHGLRVSFSPKVTAEGVGNGGHVHLSPWRDGVNLMSGGSGHFGLTPDGAAFTAGLLQHLPGLLAFGAPSVASYLRLVPSHWAGAYAAWGLENRETALRFVTGAAGQQQSAANVEVKCFDATANPYLVLAGLLAAGRDGLRTGAVLPEPVAVDPGRLTDDERQAAGIPPLPSTLEEAVRAFEADAALTGFYGEQLTTTIGEVRRGEIALFAGATPEEIARTTRWRH
jgi:glutamine synthetase